jgi:hypothetical protein
VLRPTPSADLHSPRAGPPAFLRRRWSGFFGVGPVPAIASPRNPQTRTHREEGRESLGCAIPQILEEGGRLRWWLRKWRICGGDEIGIPALTSRRRYVASCSSHEQCALVVRLSGASGLVGDWHFTLLDEVLRVEGPAGQRLTRLLSEHRSVRSAVVGAVPGLVSGATARDVTKAIVGMRVAPGLR